MNSVPQELIAAPVQRTIQLEQLQEDYQRLLQEKRALEMLVQKDEERRHAFIHILSDLNTLNRKLTDQRKAMIHILADSHQANLRLENSRKAMIHIMSDLKETTEEVQHREQELREKQEQLVQAGKLATLGELTTGVAHELNNPLNNIGLFIGNAIDLIELGMTDPNPERILQELHNAMHQVYKATEIISHLRTFGRANTVSREPVGISHVVRRALTLVQEQLRLRQIEVKLLLPDEEVFVMGNAIQLEQVFINLLTNARDAMVHSTRKIIAIECTKQGNIVDIHFSDTGAGIPVGLEQRIFDPFFTTKEVGAGTGLGLSITYGIIKEHQGAIVVENCSDEGALFLIQLPLEHDEM